MRHGCTWRRPSAYNVYFFYKKSPPLLYSERCGNVLPLSSTHQCCTDLAKINCSHFASIVLNKQTTPYNTIFIYNNLFSSLKRVSTKLSLPGASLLKQKNSLMTANQAPPSTGTTATRRFVTIQTWRASSRKKPTIVFLAATFTRKGKKEALHSHGYVFPIWFFK